MPGTVMPELHFIDVGCGDKKQPGAIGIDWVAGPGVDQVCDLNLSPLPFPADTVGRIFSSHCIEHLNDPVTLLREISRVGAHGARVELWHPYSGHHDAFLFDHRAFLNERNYVHMASEAPAFWKDKLGAWWRVEELVFAIPGDVLDELADAEVDPDFAVKYLANVVCELGVLATLDKRTVPPASAPPPRRVYAVSRKPEDRRPLVRPLTRKPPPPEGFGGRLRALLGSVRS
jgi:SAM-dependent methyltransferase